MTRYHVDKTAPWLGYYEVFHGPEGYRWHWTEVAKDVRYEDAGPWFSTASAAYEDAADDWHESGDSANRRLSGLLRAASTRARRKEANA